MKLLKTRILRGPNAWSYDYNKLIAADIEVSKEERMVLKDKYLLPFVSKVPGHIFDNFDSQASVGDIIGSIAIALQNSAGMDCSFYEGRESDGISRVIFEYETEKAGEAALAAAFEIIQSVLQKEIPDVAQEVEFLKKISKRYKLGPTTQAIVDEAERKGIPWRRPSNDSLIILGYGRNQQSVKTAVTGLTGNIAVELAGNKERTRNRLAAAHVPVAKGMVVETPEELKTAIDTIGFPLAVKPIDGNHGRGISLNVRSFDDALKAFQQAQIISHEVIVERFFKGYDFRILVVGNKFVAAARRTPAMVTGDGKSTVQELVDAVNLEPERGDGHESSLTKISIDRHTLDILESRSVAMDTVLPQGETLFLKGTANISSGGTATDVTDEVHIKNIRLAERISRIVGLDICGIDIVAEGLNEPVTTETGAVVEVNAGPGLRMHLNPTHGLNRNVAEPIIDMLFPEGKASRIPIVAITGTNGKTTSTRLMAHLASIAGYYTGFTTTEGIYIDGDQIYSGDCSGPASAGVVLGDPFVDFAILECARGGILRSGLGFDKCSVSIVTNVAEDHLGLDGVNSIEDLARVKEVVPRSTMPDCYAVLNADDDLVYDMRRRVSCKIALFSMDPGNPRIIEHCKNAGIAAFIDNGWFVVSKGPWKSRIMKVKEVPLSFGGTATAMIKNILPVMLAAMLSGFSNEVIIKGLKSFEPSPKTTPGRMNIFRFTNFSVIVDYAHNEAGYKELGNYLAEVATTVKIGIISGTGDRRDSDIKSLGTLAAGMFDEIIIKHEKDSRGRKSNDIEGLLIEGIREAKPEMNVTVIPDELEAVRTAIVKAVQDSLIVVCADDINGCIGLVSQLQQQIPA